MIKDYDSFDHHGRKLGSISSLVKIRADDTENHPVRMQPHSTDDTENHPVRMQPHSTDDTENRDVLISYDDFYHSHTNGKKNEKKKC